VQCPFNLVKVKIREVCPNVKDVPLTLAEKAKKVFFFFIYKLRTQCHTIIAETVQNSNRHWCRPTQVLKHLRVALKHI